MLSQCFHSKIDADLGKMLGYIYMMNIPHDLMIVFYYKYLQ